MDVVVVTPELAHYGGSSTLAESAGALAKSLRGLDHKVTVLTPLWASVDPVARHLARRLVRFEVAAPSGLRTLGLFDGKTTAGVDVAFLAEPELFGEGSGPDEEGPRAAVRWGAFVRAAVAFLKSRTERGEPPPDVVHVFGWQLGVLPVAIAEESALGSVTTVFTTHDLARKGVFDRAHLAELGLSPKHFAIEGVEFFGRVSTLKAGLQYAMRVIAPSPSLASRFLLEAGGDGLEGVLRARGRAFVGIADGVDGSIWNPATDPHLDVRFDAVEMASRGIAKVRNKSALQVALGLPLRDDVPLMMTVLRGRADERAFLTALPRVLRNDVQLVVLSKGPVHEDVADLARRFPDRLAARETDDAFLHRCLGAAEVVIVAAVDDPFAVLALEAQRYGAAPVARAEGLVADCVVDADAGLVSGTGFTFDEASADALFGAIMRARGAFDDRPRFRALQARAMSRDHSWDRAARLVEKVYRGARASSVEAPASA